MKEKEIFALEYEITKTDGNTKQYVYNRETDSFADKTDSYGKETLFTKKELKDFLESLSPENPLWTSIVFPIYAVKTDGTGSVKERTPITGHDTYAKNEYLADALTLMPSRMFDSKDVLEAKDGLNDALGLALVRDNDIIINMQAIFEEEFYDVLFEEIPKNYDIIHFE